MGDSGQKVQIVVLIITYPQAKQDLTRAGNFQETQQSISVKGHSELRDLNPIPKPQICGQTTDQHWLMYDTPDKSSSFSCWSISSIRTSLSSNFLKKIIILRMLQFLSLSQNSLIMETILSKLHYRFTSGVTFACFCCSLFFIQILIS